ncbi:MAG: matrixin family metalloprotease [Fimbriimonadaceae bacterium]|nr:matrixin family metalloprotease [Fimbriimonadaceae bacterium]
MSKMVDHVVIQCPNCSQRLRLPDTDAEKRVRCGRCGHRFRFSPRAGVQSSRRRNLQIAGWVAGVAAALSLVVFFFFTGRTPREHETSPQVKSTETTKSTANPKSEPGILWRIGNISPEFRVSAAQVQTAVERAVELWESAAGKPLFTFDSTRGFPIDLVYDHRQVLWNTRQTAEAEIEKRRLSVGKADQESKEAVAKLDAENKRLQSQKEAYDAKLDDFNRRVEEVNSQGGAAPEAASVLDEERRSLDDDRNRLLQAVQALERFKVEVDQLVERRNQQAQALNRAVEAFNTQYGKTAVQLGQCVRRGSVVERIEVFAFSDENHLAIILAHELGHALGIEHVEGDGALMSAVEEGSKAPTQLKLTARDIGALQKAQKSSLVLPSPAPKG